VIPQNLTVSAGHPWPLGASLSADGVNFAVFSGHATGMDLCLFSPDGDEELARLLMSARSGDIWHIHVVGIGAGQLYGLRAHGPYSPSQGHRFNVNKLLLDPHGKAIAGELLWSDSLMGYQVGSPKGDLSFDTHDSAPAMPKSVVVDDAFEWDGDRAPLTALEDTVIYEAHVKSLTMQHPDIPEQMRGTYAGLGHPAVISHLQALGITAIELLPIQVFFDDRFLVAKGLRNHWGYNTVCFFAPEPRYGTADQLKTSIKALHMAGIEVLLDVVYNHTGEGDEFGPTLCHRGLDNVSYYRLTEGGRRYANDAGTGNTLNLSQNASLRMVMDSLRYWVEAYHIDGFRFDLASVLGREMYGFSSSAGFLDAIRQDPILARVKLIAEPWDIGPGGYQLGGFPPPFAEWNDQFRDGVRRFWNGDVGQAPDLAQRILGSAAQFDHSRRSASSSVNYIAAHDGFTLQDLVTYSQKRNLTNGEDNRDGHDNNHSDNMGFEGPSDDPVINDARGQRKRNLLATLLLSQGTPMLLAGDEMGHSQGGNNNAYAQDNATSWMNWATQDYDLTRFVAKVTGLRHAHPVLRQTRFLHGQIRADGLRDVIWRCGDGGQVSAQDWHGAASECFGVELRMAAEGPDADDAAYIVFNSGPQILATLPDTCRHWAWVLDTSQPDLAPQPVNATADIAAQSVAVFVKR
jgi:isoamylase